MPWFGLINLRLVGIIAGCIALFFGGWYVNGYRWDAKYKDLEHSYATAAVQAEEKARQETAQLQTAIEAERKSKDEQLQVVTTRLDSALSELRQRSSRSAAKTTASCAPSAATGAQLSREDAEFLAREAARADAIIARLSYCEAAYEEARKALAEH